MPNLLPILANLMSIGIVPSKCWQVNKAEKWQSVSSEGNFQADVQHNPLPMPAQSDAIPFSTKGDSSASSEPIPNNRKQSLLWIDYWSQQRITSTQKHLAHGWKLTCLMSIPGQLQVDQCALDSYKANLVSFLPQSKASQDSIIPGANILLPIDSLCWSNLMPILGQFSANVASEPIQNLCHT